MNTNESTLLNVNFNNLLLQQKINSSERKDSFSIINYTSSNVSINNCNSNNQNKNSKFKEKEKVFSETAFNYEAYFAKVEKMSKILEESFAKEREKCLTVVEIEDRPHITNDNLSGLVDISHNDQFQVRF